MSISGPQLLLFFAQTTPLMAIKATNIVCTRILPRQPYITINFTLYFSRSGDEATAMGMMKRLGKLGEEMNAKDGESNADADDSTDTTLGL